MNKSDFVQPVLRGDDALAIKAKRLLTAHDIASRQETRKAGDHIVFVSNSNAENARVLMLQLTATPIVFDRCFQCGALVFPEDLRCPDCDTLVADAHGL